MSPPNIGCIVTYRTDGRNGMVYDLPAIVTCTADTHPGDYPDGKHNPLPVPEGDSVHLTVFTPGGFGTTVGFSPTVVPDDADFVGAHSIKPGSGSYVEWSVPRSTGSGDPLGSHVPEARSWRPI